MAGNDDIGEESLGVHAIDSVARVPYLRSDPATFAECETKRRCPSPSSVGRKPSCAERVCVISFKIAMRFETFCCLRYRQRSANVLCFTYSP
jgi:hypothetical protein